MMCADHDKYISDQEMFSTSSITNIGKEYSSDGKAISINIIDGSNYVAKDYDSTTMTSPSIGTITISTPSTLNTGAYITTGTTAGYLTGMSNGSYPTTVSVSKEYIDETVGKNIDLLVDKIDEYLTAELRHPAYTKVEDIGSTLKVALDAIDMLRDRVAALEKGMRSIGAGHMLQEKNPTESRRVAYVGTPITVSADTLARLNAGMVREQTNPPVNVTKPVDQPLATYWNQHADSVVDEIRKRSEIAKMPKVKLSDMVAAEPLPAPTVTTILEEIRRRNAGK
jgi:hypothetical protein